MTSPSMIPAHTRQPGRTLSRCAGTAIRNCSNTFARTTISLLCCWSANRNPSTARASSFRNISGGKMRLKAACVVCLVAGFVLAVAGFAQEGHPLTGVWYGDWGPNATTRNHLTVQMQWDGKNVTGIVNPGPDSYPLKVVTLDSSKWTVHIEADGKDTN